MSRQVEVGVAGTVSTSGGLESSDTIEFVASVAATVEKLAAVAATRIAEINRDRNLSQTGRAAAIAAAWAELERDLDSLSVRSYGAQFRALRAELASIESRLAGRFNVAGSDAVAELRRIEVRGLFRDMAPDQRPAALMSAAADDRREVLAAVHGSPFPLVTHADWQAAQQLHADRYEKDTLGRARELSAALALAEFNINVARRTKQTKSADQVAAG